MAVLENRMNGLGDSLDRVVERYLQRLEAATAVHLEQLTQRLGSVDQWAPQVHQALERMRPDAEQATASLDVLRGQSTAALEQMRDRLGQVVDQTGRLVVVLQAATESTDRRRRVGFWVALLVATGAAAYLGWRFLLEPWLAAGAR